ncbi:MAG TPA: AI-2E family transporter, partial [Actinomycetota bacterium]|nr:AI-2E family transporter [Actinomycetota bacterium]
MTATGDERGSDDASPAGGEARWPPVTYWMRVAAGVLVVLLLFRALAAIQNVVVLLLISLVLALGLQPAIDVLTRRGMRRGWAVAIIYTTTLVVAATFLALIVPVIVREIGNLIEEAPEYLERAQEGNGFIAQLDERFDLRGKLRSLGEDVPGTALGLVRSFAALVFNTLTVAILTAIFAVRLPDLRRGVTRLLRREHREDFEQILGASTQRVGGYVIGNIIVSLIAGVVSFVALALLGVPYPAALAFWVAIADLIPTIGATLGAVVAVAVAAFAGPVQLIGSIAFFAVYQQIENYVIAPRVMKRAIDMSPGAVIIAVLVGGSLAGFVGGLLA